MPFNGYSNKTQHHPVVSSSYTDTPGNYYSTGVAAGDLDDWVDDESSQAGGWGGEDTEMLDDVVNLAEKSLKEQKRIEMQKRIQQHHERNLRKQMEKQSRMMQSH